jgi:glycosyltransferase involved in cell wall biosynthesis
MNRIALVRGHHLSKEETVSYEPLRDEFSFTCFSSSTPWFDHSEIAFPVRRLPVAESLAEPLPGLLGRRAFGFVDGRLGAGQWMYGLGRALRGFDIVHTSDVCHLFSYQAARAKRAGGYRLVVIQYENIPFAREDRALIRSIKPVVYAATDMFFAMSDRARDALVLEGVPDGRIAVIGNSVDTERFRPRPEERRTLRASLGFGEDECIVLFVGRLHESKGVLHLVHALALLLSDPGLARTRLRLVIAGRGNRERHLRERVDRLGLGDRVTFVGGVPHSRIHLLYPAADIFTLPSIPLADWQEQFGIVLIESMACGVPVVSTLSGSIPDVVGDAAVLVQPADARALAQGLRSLIDDPLLRAAAGERARSRVVKQFALPVVADRIRNAYTSILQNPPR